MLIRSPNNRVGDLLNGSSSKSSSALGHGPNLLENNFGDKTSQICQGNNSDYCREVKNECLLDCEFALPTGNYGFRFWNCVNRCL